MHPDSGEAQPDAARQAWERLLRPLAATVDERAHDLSVAMIERVEPALPELFADPDAAEANRASAEASIRALAALLEAGGALHDIELPPQTATYAREAVRRGIPLLALMRSYRLGHGALSDILGGHVAERAESKEELAEALALLSRWMFAYADAIYSLVDHVYSAERERWARSAAAAQADTVDAILGGRTSDAARAGLRLRYELDREHVGLIAWLDEPPEDADSIDLLEAAVARLAELLQASSVLVRPLSGLVTSAWLTVPPGTTLPDLRLDTSTTLGVRAALGEPGSGLAGFRLTHEQAAHARRVATLARRSPGSVTRFGRVGLASLGTADVDQATAFVARHLGGLAGDDDTARRLAATLRVYLDEHCSRSRTARTLGLHENTVSYRVRQAEELLGRSVDEDTIELHVALVLAGVVKP